MTITEKLIKILHGITILYCCTVLALFFSGLISGIILVSLEASQMINIGWFWASFPFWGPWCAGCILSWFNMAVTFIIAGLDNLIKKEE